MKLVMMTAALAAAGQSAALSPALAPVGKWTVEYNKGDCTLSHQFGDARAPITFGFKPSVGVGSGELVLIVPGGADEGTRRGTGKITLSPSGKSFDVRWARGPLKQADAHGVVFDANRQFWDALPDADSLELDVGEPKPVRLAIGPMANALEAVKICGDDLLRSWGADPAALIGPADEDVATWFGPDQYPSSAKSAHEEGRVTTLSTINAAGKPTDCKIVESSGSPALDRETCAIIKSHGHFDKAQAGVLAIRYFYVAVRWALVGG